MLPERVGRERKDGRHRAVPAGGGQRRLDELRLLLRLLEGVAVGKPPVEEYAPVLDRHIAAPVFRLDGEHARRPGNDMVDMLAVGDKVVEDVVGVGQMREYAGDALLAARALEEALGVAKPLQKAPARICDRRHKQRKPPHHVGKSRCGDGETSYEHAEKQGPKPCHHALHPGPLARNSVYIGHKSLKFDV